MTDTGKRTIDLTCMLRERQHELQTELHLRVRAGRTERPSEGRDDLERSEADSQGALAFALLQMKTETLTHIDAALVRIDAGQYGSCCECDGEIAERRLRALPFAVRCQGCEETRERAEGRARQAEHRRSSPSPFLDTARS